MLNPFLVFLAFCFTFFSPGNSAYSTTAPIWLPSPYFRAGNNKVITSVTGAGVVKMYTFTFSSAVSGVPNLAYGVKNYRGMDTMKTQSFEILRVNLTSSQFTVSIQIFGITNIWVLTVPYLVIDPQFPHNLNSFDNVPINYTYGPLVNISSFSPTTTTFTNTINYTKLSLANKFYTFTDPLSANKIVLFLTSFQINATAGIPMDFSVNVSILNSSHYTWTVTINSKAYIAKVHFSMIVYNEEDVMSSKLYMIVYEQWTAYVAGNYSYTPFPQQLTDNMITALVDFNAIAGDCGLQYNWQFVANFSGYPYVIYLNRSVPAYVYCGFNRTRSSVFYIKTWKCGAPYIYYNLTSDGCQNGCADYFYANSTTGTCEACYYTCINCSAPADPKACTTCQSGFNRTLVNGSCTCNSGYFDDWYSLTCRACSTVDSHCLTCTYPYNSSKNYTSIFTNTSWPTNIKPDYKCTLCATSYFINSSNLCQFCPLNYCIMCLTATECKTCNSSANAIKYTNGLCYLCTVAHCSLCSADNVCVACTAGFYVSNGACLSCAEICTCGGWVLPKLANGTCSTLCGDGIKIGAEECDDGNTNDHDGCSSTCTVEACNVSCVCDGWIQPWVTTNGSCTSVCGDSLVRGSQQCDDGNTKDHDGCSSTCQNEPCSISCLCDGWVLPWSNSSCSTVCGDNFLRGTQQCDDGNTNNHDGCSSTCQLESCNVSCLCDGWVQPWTNGSCSTLCGDSLKRGSEQCDDGNTNDHDGCSSICVSEPCNISCLCDGWTSPWVSNSCTPVCGDSLVRGTQTCDDGNVFDHDGCSSTCQIEACDANCSCDGWAFPWTNNSCTPICGDKLLRGRQQCDDGNTNEHDGCSSTCQTEPCNISCKCDGWVQPWWNGACTTVCGDSLVRGFQTCDDGNTQDLDGCSSDCQVEPCDISCLCDGWILPRINGTCSTLCGDGLVRGDEECDDANKQDFDYCHNNCTWFIIPEPQVPVLLSASMSTYPSLALLILGFRMVGLEATNVFQSFQLLLFTQGVQTFDLSFNVHGYANPAHFPMEILPSNHIFPHFNFMYLAVMVVFVLGAVLELFHKVSKNQNKILNFYDNKTKKNIGDHKSEVASEDSNSDEQSDFTVHVKSRGRTKKIINIIEPFPTHTQRTLPPEDQRSGSLFFRQIFFDLVVNCQYIFVFGVVTQIMNESSKSFLNFSVIVVVSSMLFILLLIMLICPVENISFGQNQLKLLEHKAVIYWILVFGERTFMATMLALSAKEGVCVYVMLGMKSILVLIYASSNLYVERIQKIRSVTTHFLHFLLILSFVLNKLIFKPQKMLYPISMNFIEYVYSFILGTILFISICFYVRQMTKNCQADIRQPGDSAKQIGQHAQQQVSAVFDVKEKFSIDDGMSELNSDTLKTKSNIFNDLKTMDFLPKSKANIANSGSSTPIRYSARSKKVISSNYLTFLKQSSGQTIATPLSSQNKNFQKHRRHINKTKHNIFDQDANQHDDLVIFTPSKSKWDLSGNHSNHLGQQLQEPDESRLRPSIDSVVRHNSEAAENQQNLPPSKKGGFVKEIRRIGLKSRKRKGDEDGYISRKVVLPQEKQEHSANNLIKVDDFQSKLSTVTNVFKDPLKNKKRTFANKRFKQIKKGEQPAQITNYSGLDNLDIEDDLSINMD